jgi:hypothetical protein
MNTPTAITTATGIKGREWNVRLVEQGDAYGRNGCLTHDDPRPVVEFYDATYAGKCPDEFTGHLGQFVSRYYVFTLEETDWREYRYLDLDGGIPEWRVTGESVADALDVVRAAVTR